MAALYGAFPFKKINIIAMLVAEELDFDMLGCGYIFFHKNSIIPKGAHGFTFSGAHLLFQLGFVFHYTHTFSTTAGRGFYQYRIAYLAGYGACFFKGFDGVFGAR